MLDEEKKMFGNLIDSLHPNDLERKIIMLLHEKKNFDEIIDILLENDVDD
ncbi:hypothetical protein DSAG12_03019 [Promethearchaeum syntrophicum]|uniref:Uncharacterized protein n=1 Tax=Promethearchaeum syntrophicum TaxID=2594042 RepID=A0A5B9DEB9_9ARCH|nr:hypothetical protein [Candidatus Prometheoarchaeum syntrophicum]QEE17187.1 hypothetical protein DSAG12_03019 [Candidatus Prometheoarchaeum syntrophicum]